MPPVLVAPLSEQFALNCNRLRPVMTSLCRRSMLSFASASSPVYLASSAATSCWQVSRPIHNFTASFIPAQELVSCASVITGIEFSQEGRCRQRSGPEVIRERYPAAQLHCAVPLDSVTLLCALSMALSECLFPLFVHSN